MAVDLARMRLEYESSGIDVADVDADPIVEFERWLQIAIDAELTEPNAMVVSTVDDAGQPWSRYVLLKAVSADGFDFYTNYESHKSAQLTANPRAAITFGWLPLRRQVNIAGRVERVPDAASDAYWAVRPRGSQLGGWASDQSRPVADRAALVAQEAAADARYPDDVPRPPHWGGWRVIPDVLELWQGRPNRLHDRLRYTHEAGGRWSLERLAP